MTRVLDLCSNAFLYAQALDNSGESEYWILRYSKTRPEKLESLDPRLRLIRELIDTMAEMPQCIISGSNNFECRAKLSGDCVITIRPTTLDADGRISPMLFLFNLYSAERGRAPSIMYTATDTLERKLGDSSGAELLGLAQELARPLWILFFRVFIAKVRNTKLLNLT